MLDPWNDLTLEPPPINTTPIGSNIDVKCLLYTCVSIQKVLLNQSPLHKESAILSRFNYKYDKKFRSDIGFRYFKKVNTALHKYLKLNLLKDIEVFISVLPKSNEERYLPTRQMLQYLMVHMVSFSKIMMRICICSKQAAIHYMDRVKRGQTYWMSLMPFALLSRIWSFSLVLVRLSCSWYSSLFPYLDKLQSKGLDFLPIAFSLPTNLNQLVDIDNVDNYGRYEWHNKKKVKINMDLIEDEEVDFDSILDYVRDVNKHENTEESITFPTDKIVNDIQALSDSSKSVDEGQVVSREYFQSFFNVSDDAKKNCRTHNANEVTSKTSLDKFISTEETLRNKDSNQSLTRHLSFMQWQCLKTALLKLSDPLSKNRKIERKFQKIWKEKCMDYL